MAGIPHDKHLDNTFSLLQDGYDFIQKKRAGNKTNIVTVRLMRMNVTCLGGEAGARLFYDPEKFQRKGAVPKRVQKTLTGEGAIQTLDYGQHQQRKQLFMSLIWITTVIENIRQAPPQSNITAAEAIAHYLEDGQLLNARMAAIELINLLPPTVAYPGL